jgi:uncharacterized repeat protein (TIGR03833 family)
MAVIATAGRQWMALSCGIGTPDYYGLRPDVFYMPVSLFNIRESPFLRNTGIMEHYRKGQQRSSIRIGFIVDIIRKEDQRSGRKTRGTVQEILTSSSSHPHGIKVRLNGGHVGRVADIIQTVHSEDREYYLQINLLFQTSRHGGARF